MLKTKSIFSELRRVRAEDGFTLIELVIVVAIIGILTAIAIPAYGAIQENARQSAVDSTIKSRISQIASVAAAEGIAAAKIAANTRTPSEANIFVLPTTGSGASTATGICQLVVYLNDSKTTDEYGTNTEFLSKIQYIYSGQSLTNAPFAWAGAKVSFENGDPEFEILNSSNYLSSCPIS